uniref:uncharacterized protein n=1 Tax=Myxine glutinosa TaxID=7769 RepID=UPI00358EFCDB
MEQPQSDEYEMGELMGLVLHTTKMEEGYQHILHTVLHNGQRHKLPLRSGDIIISICGSDAAKMNHNEVEDKLRFTLNISLLLHRPGQQVVENELPEIEAQDGNEKMAEVTFPGEREGEIEEEKPDPSFDLVCEDNILLPSDMALTRGEEVHLRVDDMPDDHSEEEGHKMASITQKNRAQHHAICHRPQQETTRMSAKTPSVTKVSEMCCSILGDVPKELHDETTSLILYRNAQLGDSASRLRCVEQQQQCPVCIKGGSNSGCADICVEIEHKVENPVKVQRVETHEMVDQRGNWFVEHASQDKQRSCRGKGGQGLCGEEERRVRSKTRKEPVKDYKAINIPVVSKSLLS